MTDQSVEEQTISQSDQADTPAAPTPPPEPPLEPRRPEVGRASAWVRLVAAGVLVVLVLASAAYLVTRGVRDGSVFSAGGTDLAGDRDTAMSQARQFALRLNTYGPDLLQGKTMPGYRTQVEQVLTDAYKADFEQGATLADATVSQTGVKATAQVWSTGVAAIDADTATVLVAGDLSYAYPKKAGSKEYVTARDEPYRWEVDLDKVNGTWLVDSFNPAESGAVSTTTQGDGAQ
jgi:Mce-associated membrane protein